MTKFLALIAAIVFCANTAHADNTTTFVDYKISDEVELYENAWRLASITPVTDLRQSDEPVVACKAKLELFDPNDPLLYVNFQVVPDGDFEVYYLGRWMLASRFEYLMKTTGCMTEGSPS